MYCGEAVVVEVDVRLLLWRCMVAHTPLQLHERALTVLQCRYVDEVVFGAPFALSEEFIRALKINVVVHGKHDVDPIKTLPAETDDPYKVPPLLLFVCLSVCLSVRLCS